MSELPESAAKVTRKEEIPADFPLSRFLHCHNVGLRMYSYAKNHWGWAEERCHDMYILGMMHDIGYELNPDAFEHDVAMAEALGHAGYKYMKEIFYHSSLQTEYDTLEMRLLYFADATVDGKGRWCTLDERLQDLEERHGRDSEVYIESVKIANAVRAWGFKDKVTEKDFITSIPSSMSGPSL